MDKYDPPARISDSARGLDDLFLAILAAVATCGGNPVSGYGNGFFVAAAIAALLAVLAAFVLPALRPAPGTHVSMH